MACKQNLDLRCVLISDPSTLDAGAKTLLESRIKKFAPQHICRPHVGVFLVDVGPDNDDTDCMRAALHAYRLGYLDLVLVVCNGAHRLAQGVTPGQEMRDRVRLAHELCRLVLHHSGTPFPPIYIGAHSAAQQAHFGLPPAPTSPLVLTATGTGGTATGTSTCGQGRGGAVYGWVLPPKLAAPLEARPYTDLGQVLLRATGPVVLYGMAGATELLYFCRVLLPIMAAREHAASSSSLGQMPQVAPDSVSTCSISSGGGAGDIVGDDNVTGSMHHGDDRSSTRASSSDSGGGRRTAYGPSTLVVSMMAGVRALPLPKGGVDHREIDAPPSSNYTDIIGSIDDSRALLKPADHKLRPRAV